MQDEETQGRASEGRKETDAMTRETTKEVGKFVLTIEPEALRSIVASGRLLELADTLAREAAIQIAAQIVEQVAAAALEPNRLQSGASASTTFIFDGGDFGTVPPRPKWGVGPIRDILSSSALRQVVALEVQG